ncbi:DNA-binding protein [Salmonella enterica]|uniref:single-stranded DNA-binding protein n=1 Tax=Salmonella enterica TaxID=28901 RepID=UPI002FFADC27
MITIEIHETQVNFEERSGVSQRTGKPYTIREQGAYAHLGGAYPQLFKLNLQDGQQPYAAGKYRLHLSSFEINRYGNLSVGRILLESIKS